MMVHKYQARLREFIFLQSQKIMTLSDNSPLKHKIAKYIIQTQWIELVAIDIYGNERALTK